MEEERETGKVEWINFNYHNSEVKYYLLTQGSGYPLAEFFPLRQAIRQGGGVIVPENRPKTASIPPVRNDRQPVL